MIDGSDDVANGQRRPHIGRPPLVEGLARLARLDGAEGRHQSRSAADGEQRVGEGEAQREAKGGQAAGEGDVAVEQQQDGRHARLQREVVHGQHQRANVGQEGGQLQAGALAEVELANGANARDVVLHAAAMVVVVAVDGGGGVVELLRLGLGLGLVVPCASLLHHRRAAKDGLSSLWVGDARLDHAGVHLEHRSGETGGAGEAVPARADQRQRLQQVHHVDQPEDQQEAVVGEDRLHVLGSSRGEQGFGCLGIGWQNGGGSSGGHLLSLRRRQLSLSAILASSLGRAWNGLHRGVGERGRERECSRNEERGEERKS